MNNKIALNFLPIENQNFDFLIYRKLSNGNEKRPDEAINGYKLPLDDHLDADWQHYWVTFDNTDGYEEFICKSDTNPYLTELYLFWELKQIKEKKNDIIKIGKIAENFYSKRIFFIVKEYKTGKQTIWLEPYYLKTEKEFGFLIDFDFIKDKDVPFDKEVQKLSLSLNSSYRVNNNYHSDKFDFVKSFIKNVLSEINQLNDSVDISDKLKVFNAKTLETKVYRVNNENTSPSQFMGIKNKGPFEKLQAKPQFYFIFKKIHIDYARDLVKALRGTQYRTFEGMKKMFGVDFDTSKESLNINHIIIENFTKEDINKVNEKLKEDSNNKIAVFIFPEAEEEYYYSVKNILLGNNIVTQGIHIETLKDETKLKWSVSSLALQMFAKLGGIPWRMKPSNDNCLIIGIGQAHDVSEDETGKKYITKYFSYSVLMDSSGEYKSMNVLAENKDEESYLEELSKKIKEILLLYQAKYNKITIHIPYKIKHKEIAKIKNAAEEVRNEIEVVVLKINDNSKYFGYNPEHNSLIPYESSFIQLSHNDYLVWTEGLNYNNKKANKHYANPLYVNFYYINKELEDINTASYLQDVLNLTGANWRGFNAKAIPISMFYPKIISKFIKFFNKYNLDKVEFENLPPWFL
ncbi:MAG: hypothetical protein GXO79_00150 [Chlorobi bacterium]|nr:hypothetical protein [Chlorobiota bacterium]